MDNVINFEDYKKKNEGGFAPVKVMMTLMKNKENKKIIEETKTRD